MDVINQGVISLNKGIDGLTDYVRENGIAIGVLFLIIYYIRSSATKKKNELFHGYVLAKESTSAKNATSREEELRQVRLKQQELVNQRAAEAAEITKEKERIERERKNHVAKKKKQSQDSEGDRLGDSTETSTSTPTTTSSSTTTKKKKSSTSSSSSSSNTPPPSYNPMQPWTSHSSGYRPARRNVNRGG